MLEMIIVVTMIGVLASLVVVNVIAHVRNLYQMELDQTAKELYVAAQNHLTVAEAMGQLKGKTGDQADPNEADTYYIVYKGDGAQYGQANNILSTMLPWGSIDETVRAGGSYIVRYQYQQGSGGESDHATVLDVFYANPHGSYTTFNNYGQTFENGDIATLFAANTDTDFRGEGEKSKQARQNYIGSNDEGSPSVIGYYGGAAATGSLVDAPKPEVEVENAEVLRAIVTLTDGGTPVDPSGNATRTPKAELYITGMASGVQYGPIPLSLQNRDATRGAYSFVLDSVTDSGKHFAEQFPSLIPGEDIQIQAFAYWTDSPKVASSAPVVTNSLFSALTKEGDSRSARITNIRHFANLSTAISGFDMDTAWTVVDSAAAVSAGTTTGSIVQTIEGRRSGTTPKAADQAAPTSAYQASDLDWGRFKVAVAGSAQQADNVSIFEKKSSQTPKSSAAGSFMPVNPEYELDYDGKGFNIENIKVSITAESGTAENAGLFGTLPADSKISNLNLVDFDISTTNGTAGALAGTAEGAEIDGVIAYNTPAGMVQSASLANSAITNGINAAFDVINTNKVTRDEEANHVISGSGATGGLVGEMKNGSSGTNTVSGKIINSAASVYVASSGDVAGGLVGSATGGTIEKSYAGGHTIDGMYVQPVKDGSGNLTGFETPETGAGRWNVRAGTAAGGLVGSSSGTEIKQCYSTASAKGATAGGLVGTSTTGKIDSCYATGLVSGSTANTQGAFVGTASGTSLEMKTEEGKTVPSNYVYELVNNPDIAEIKANASSSSTSTAETTSTSSTDEETTVLIPAIGNDSTSTSVSALDETLESYQSFVNGTGKAVPYDTGYTVASAELSKGALPKVYTLKSIANLAGLSEEEANAAPWFIRTHVGDWPTPETLVVNVSQR